MQDYFMTATPITDAMAVTNADRIRAMRDEELAEAIYKLYDRVSNGPDIGLVFCDGKNSCIDGDGNITCDSAAEKKCILRWLRLPAKEENSNG